MTLFAKERDMLEIVQDWLRPQVTYMETELYCGFAGEYVPDIVGVCFDVGEVSRLKRRNPLARGRIRKLLADNRPPTKYHTDLIAVELKLNRFAQAFFQAIVYSNFGFRAYIAMPEYAYFNLTGIKHEALEIAGIGFLDVGKDSCTERVKAKNPVVVSVEDEYQIADRLMCRFRGRATVRSEGAI